MYIHYPTFLLPSHSMFCTHILHFLFLPRHCATTFYLQHSSLPYHATLLFVSVPLYPPCTTCLLLPLPLASPPPACSTLCLNTPPVLPAYTSLYHSAPSAIAGYKFTALLPFSRSCGHLPACKQQLPVQTLLVPLLAASHASLFLASELFASVAPARAILVLPSLNSSLYPLPDTLCNLFHGYGAV